MKSEFGQIGLNLDQAGIFIAQAAQCGAKIVLLPEFMPSGYLPTEEIWKYAETISGRSIDWLLETAKRHHIYLGFTFVESDGKDFYNTFVLSNPDGILLGRVRKSPPCSQEAYYFRSGSDAHVIETEIGRIGIGICYENLLFKHMRLMSEAHVDFMLMPAAAGKPASSASSSDHRIKEKRKHQIKKGARSIFVDSLGVPIIIANITEGRETALPENLPSFRTGFPNTSSIVDGNGVIKAQGGEAQGIVMGEITLNSNVGSLLQPKRYRFLWSVPVPWYSLLWWTTQKMGAFSYWRNMRRKAQAQQTYLVS